MTTVTLSDGERQQVLDVLYSELSRIDGSEPLTRLDNLRRRKVRRQFVRLIVKFETPDDEQEEPTDEGALPENREG